MRIPEKIYLNILTGFFILLICFWCKKSKCVKMKLLTEITNLAWVKQIDQK